MKWPLPEVVHPTGTLCFQINVPNEIHYVAAFYGAMFLLTKPYAWGDDSAHTALEVGKVWMSIYDKLAPGGCASPTPPFGHGIDQEDLMPLRVDCDCNVFVTCCDGTEKQIFTADQVIKLLSNGGAGTPQPQPGGGCQIYHMTVPAGTIGQLIPTVVNTGDTIDLSNLAGAWYSGSVSWHCPDGGIFFVACTGAEEFSGSSQMPAVPVGRVIALIDGTYYDILGSTFTVPGGIINQQITLLMNTDTPSTASGSITLDAQVCNNQAAAFTHTFDLAISPAGWTVRDQGFWTAGVGFTDGTVTYAGTVFRGADINRLSVPAFTLTRLQAFGNAVLGVSPLVFGIGASSPGAYIASQTPVSGANYLDTGLINVAGVTDLYCDLIPGRQVGVDPGGSCVIYKIIVDGIGTDPF